MSNHTTKQTIKPTINSYLVGGAVRDQLLGRTIIEKDYVVVGSSPEQMLSLGFSQVGKDFPVFLHPQTKEEYALARTEKKQGQGYTGFICNSAPDVTLEQDLLRRDLTVNAMALAADGTIIDPFNGQQDLAQRILRHVSPAFAEDPLRVLRVARFAARYHYLGFSIAAETLALMQQISNSGELTSLSAERIWKEIERSLGEKNPEVFFQVLQRCGALTTIWPAYSALWQRPPLHNKERTSMAELSLAILQQVAKFSAKPSIRFASLCLYLENDMFTPLKLPKQVQLLAQKSNQLHSLVNQEKSLKPEDILRLFDQLDAWRKPELLQDFLLVCAGEQIALNKDHPSNFYQLLASLLTLCQNVSAKAFVEQGLKGKAIKTAIYNERLRLLNTALATNT